MPRRRIAPVEPQSVDAEAQKRIDQLRMVLVEAQALSSRLSTLNETAAAIQGSLDIDVVLGTIVQQARWVLDFQHCSIALRDGMNYRIEVLKRDDGLPLDVQYHAIGDNLVSRTLLHGQAMFRTTMLEADGGPPGMQSALILPLRDGRDVIGTLNFYTRTHQRYKIEDLQVATALSVQVAATIRNIRLFNATTRAHNELFTVLESISDAVLVIDRAGRIMLLNRSLRELLHLPEGDLTGQRALWLLRVGGTTSETRRKTRDAIRPLLKTLQASPTSGGSSRFQLADGRHIEWVSAPLAATGATVGFVLTLRDVSAQVALEQLRQDMVHMLVHDLRSPLTALIMGLEMLKPPYNTEPDSSATTLEYMRQAAQDLFNQVDTILDVSKLEAGRLDLERSFANMREQIEQGVTTMHPIIRRDRQQLSLDLPTSLPLVYVDTRLIRRVIENLLGNALKFTPPGRTIGLRALSNLTSNSVTVEVQDSGLGVPPEMRERIFEKYVQVRQGRGRTGTGLGLTFCKLVVEAHGGQIGVRSVPAGGSIFWFTLPLTLP